MSETTSSVINKVFKDPNLQFGLTEFENIKPSEVLEHFQWKNEKEIEERVNNRKEEIADELGDVLIYLLQIADKLNLDIVKAGLDKLKKAANKYPVDKSKGRHTKYTEL